MGKRKASTKLSTNPHTIKARNRVSNLTPNQLIMHNAVKADSADLSFHMKKLAKDPQYQNATLAEKKI